MTMRLLLAANLVAVAIGVPAGTAWGCSCAVGTRAEAIASSEVVFAGTLTESRQSGRNELTYVFEVDTVVKGDVQERARMTTDISHRNSCSARLAPRKRYLVFGDDPEKLDHDACSPTRVIGNETVVADASPGREAASGGQRGWIVALLAVGALAGTWLLRRCARRGHP